MRLLVALVVLAAAARSSGAQPDLDRARREYDLGYQALQAGQFQAAVEHYQRSYELAPRPRTLFNLAQAEEQLGHVDDALAHYTQFVATAEPRDEAFAADARKKIEQLSARATPTPVVPPAKAEPPTPPPPPVVTHDAPHASRRESTLLVRANVGGAAVSVDGIVVGTTTNRDGHGFVVRYPLGPGEHDVLVEGPRDVVWHRRLASEGDETVTVELAFPSRGRTPAWRWGLVGLGLASEATAATLGVLALRDVATSDPDLHARGKTRALVTDALVVLGAAALYGGWRLHSNATATAIVRSTPGGAW